MKRLWLIGGLVTIASVAVGGLITTAGLNYAQVDPTKTVVVINGEEIKGHEYYHRMEHLSGVGKIMGQSFSELPPGFLTLEQLITERLVLQLAKQKGVYPSEPEVQQTIKERLAENPKFQQQWTEAGRSMEELAYVTRVELAQFKVSTFGVNVTDQEIDTHYKQNGAMYRTPKLLKLRVIAVQTEEEQKAVDADLAAGKAFADVAKARSKDLTKNSGGDVGLVPVTSLNEQVRNAVNETKIKQSTKWLQTGAGDARVKFFVEDVKPEKLLELTPELRKNIRKRLLLDRGKIKNNIAKDMLDLRAKAKVDIKDKEFAEIYEKFVQAYAKDAKLSGGGQ